ncbi:zinc-ribbon domain-containing protein [Methanobrevibacter sp.]
MKRCSRCGAENKDESNFCPNGGEIFRSDDEFYIDY